MSLLSEYLSGDLPYMPPCMKAKHFCLTLPAQAWRHGTHTHDLTGHCHCLALPLHLVALLAGIGCLAVSLGPCLPVSPFAWWCPCCCLHACLPDIALGLLAGGWVGRTLGQEQGQDGQVAVAALTASALLSLSLSHPLLQIFSSSHLSAFWNLAAFVALPDFLPVVVVPTTF